MKALTALLFVATAACGRDVPSAATTLDQAQVGSFDDRPPEDEAGRPRSLPALNAATAYVAGPGTIVTLRRTMCFGSCPVYSVGLRADGSVFFYGEGFTATSGYASSNVGAAAVAGLLAFLRSHSFLSLHTHYHRMATDNPSAIVVLRQGSALKYVEHDESNTSEPALKAIEDEIDRVAGTAAWIGRPQPMGRSSFRRPSPIPSAELARMSGLNLAQLGRACGAGVPRATAATVDVRIDDVGNATLQGGAAPMSAYACLQRKIAAAPFPLAGVYGAGRLAITLNP